MAALALLRRFVGEVCRSLGAYGAMHALGLWVPGWPPFDQEPEQPDGPPPAHPERLRPQDPLSALERSLLRQWRRQDRQERRRRRQAERRQLERQRAERRRRQREQHREQHREQRREQHREQQPDAREQRRPKR
jgi:hypothetical protein